ncbi:MAG TPA: single-stranded-DNA-specific exonuclease RecJ [Candidatus Saccharibacteria bacterium]|nr:single-stranded-DNA-specific exonuclease RecJ [Candidatus Saccharibacteria bacterium]
MTIFEKILASRGIGIESSESFLNPDYSKLHDPFLLPDMKIAVDRLIKARKIDEKITIYGDYDIDGLTATTLLYESLKKFGFKNVYFFMPSRFIEGYGLNDDAIKKIALDGTKLIITVDCGSRSHAEIKKANELGLEVIVTDHHEISDDLPPAVALVNPHRSDSKYPFKELAGVGVVFKLVQAIQVKLSTSHSKGLVLPFGQEKWLLDLVALGTVCDIVPLIDENRIFVYWGLRVLSKKRRPGLRALLSINRIENESINSHSLGFVLGPRMNAAGRLETAQYALDMLMTQDLTDAFEKAQILEEMNRLRRDEQLRILKEAIIQAEKYSKDDVLVLSDSNWSHGIIGIVASKILERYKKPVYIFQEMGVESKGSARSFGDFSAVEAIEYSGDLIIAGGGHKLAAGVTLPTDKISEFRKRVNYFYKNLGLIEQVSLLLPIEDVTVNLHEIDEKLFEMIKLLEPFGHGNPCPLLKSKDLLVINRRKMGSESQHIKLDLQDYDGKKMSFLAFSAPEHFFVEIGQRVTICYSLSINEWQGNKTIEGYIEYLEVEND